ncbi:MAG: hypothetical protein WA624_20935 [Methylocella sp.]
MAAPESGLRPLAVISGDVGGGIRYAATLIGRKGPPSFPWGGVQIEGGSILGAYLYGVSRYRSPCLPESLTLNVPKIHVANAVALFRRLDGQVEVLESESRIHVKAHNIEGFWTRTHLWSNSHSLNRLFESSPLQTVLVETLLLQNMANRLAGLFEKIQVTVEDRGADARVVMTGLYKVDRGTVYFLGKLVYSGAGNQRTWDLTIDVKDLHDAASATTTPRTLLSICDRGLLVQSEGSEDKFETFLVGSERQ